MKIGVVGLGRMGSALASALLDKGYGIAVWNRTASRAQPLVERGAVAAQDLSDLLSRSDVVVVNVLDYAASDALLRGTPRTEPASQQRCNKRYPRPPNHIPQIAGCGLICRGLAC